MDMRACASQLTNNARLGSHSRFLIPVIAAEQMWLGVKQCRNASHVDIHNCSQDPRLKVELFLSMCQNRMPSCMVRFRPLPCFVTS